MTLYLIYFYKMKDINLKVFEINTVKIEYKVNQNNIHLFDFKMSFHFDKLSLQFNKKLGLSSLLMFNLF